MAQLPGQRTCDRPRIPFYILDLQPGLWINRRLHQTMVIKTNVRGTWFHLV